jgi:hypothetical protein
MSHAKIQRLFTVISGLWVGSFIAIGFLVVPILFATLGDRQVAGVIAANLFKINAYIGVGVCSLLMLVANHLVNLGNRSYRKIRWILLLMLICTVAASCIIIPWMNALRDQALLLGISIRDTSNAKLFGLLHMVSSVVFITQSILGFALVWWSTKNAD